MTTIKNIAEQAGVSKTTVSRVLNNYKGVSEETKERILKIIRENNYIPNATARSLSTNRSFLIGLFGSPKSKDNQEFHLNNPFFRNVLDGVEYFLAKKNYDILYFPNRENINSLNYTERCKNRHVDGALFLGETVNSSNMGKLINSDIPIVFIDSKHRNKKVSYISSDNFNGAKMAVEYLIKKNHKKIGFFMGVKSIEPAKERLRGYKEGLKKYNIKYNSKWIYDGDYSVEYGYKAMKNLLKQKENPTSIICQDGIAIGAIKAIKEMGMDVPEDFSIIGFDDLEMSKYITPPLTTIRQQKFKMGEAAAKLLLHIINEDKDEYKPIIIPTKLIERESCKTLKQNKIK